MATPLKSDIQPILLYACETRTIIMKITDEKETNQKKWGLTDMSNLWQEKKTSQQALKTVAEHQELTKLT